MLQLLWLIPALPLAGFVVLALAGGRMKSRAVAAIGVGSVAAAALVSLAIAAAFIAAPREAVTQTLWTWMAVSRFAPEITLYLDPLSLVMVLVVTGVGFLIHLYAAEFMVAEEGYGRFFAYMNLFVASMLVLVLAGDLLLVYLGWEGVGLCSYLLIGFWYQEPANGRAAGKAFIITRIGDTALALGLFLIFTSLGTLEIQAVMERARSEWAPGAWPAMTVAALVLAGAIGKSAQLPLQTWLPDAMAGPTPVSALIHAATMVAAGVYLIARTHVLFELAPAVGIAVAAIGTATLLLAGMSALAQRDIKRVLAYSTISQIGYMFLALGVGAWAPAIFHFMTHAFFKALLFLAAGAVILALHHEHDLFRMGGLRKELPVAFWTFVIGAASLAGFPLLTAGFYSKDWILWEAWKVSPWLWAGGAAGAFLTALYGFRVVFLAFFGEPKSRVSRKPGWRTELSLVVLAVLALTGGFFEMPVSLGGVTLFSDFLGQVFPGTGGPHAAPGMEAILQTIVAALSLSGIYGAYLLFYRNPEVLKRWGQRPAAKRVHRLSLDGWGFDRTYDRIFARPFVAAAAANRDDVMDAMHRFAVRLCEFGHAMVSRTQTGRVRWYAAGIAAGFVILTGLVIFS